LPGPNSSDCIWVTSGPTFVYNFEFGGQVHTSSPVITLPAGTYTFRRKDTGTIHPFVLSSTAMGTAIVPLTPVINDNQTSTYFEYTFQTNHAPVYYRCTAHINMGNVFTILSRVNALTLSTPHPKVLVGSAVSLMAHADVSNVGIQFWRDSSSLGTVTTDSQMNANLATPIESVAGTYFYAASAPNNGGLTSSIIAVNVRDANAGSSFGSFGQPSCNSMLKVFILRRSNGSLTGTITVWANNITPIASYPVNADGTSSAVDISHYSQSQISVQYVGNLPADLTTIFFC